VYLVIFAMFLHEYVLCLVELIIMAINLYVDAAINVLLLLFYLLHHVL